MITGQTLAVNLIALLLTPKQTFAAISVYLLAGLIGLPVFAGGISGPAKFVSPTGGFLIGFLAAGVFVEEFRVRADAVFFASRYGRTKAAGSKVLAGLLIATIIYWAGMGILRNFCRICMGEG